MNSLLGSVAAFIVAIALLVAVHEFGHFWVARRLGFKVLRFSIGFGKPLWQRNGKDGVEYVVAAVPLGGYVRMLDERDGPVAPELMAQSYNRQAVWKRALVLLAGPFANLLFAVVACWLVLVIGEPALRPIIGPVVAGSAAERAGLRERDELLSVEGAPATSWGAAGMLLLDGVLAGRDGIALEVVAPDGARRNLVLPLADHRDLTEPGRLLTGLGLRPWFPAPPPPRLGQVEPDGPAYQGGLRPGDLIVAIDGQSVTDWVDAAKRWQAVPGGTITVLAERGNARQEFRVTVGVAPDVTPARGWLAVRVEEPAGYRESFERLERLAPVAALPAAVQRTVDLSRLTLNMLWRMLTGEASLSNISGPINIAQYAGLTASSGLITFLGFLAVISVSLGVLNLLPIPVLDGGQLAFLAAEQTTGRPVSPAVEAVGQQLGVLLLIGLMGLAFYNDIARLIG
jgi:regulator of sigma E protease